MDPVKIMVNGLPGNMAATLARHAMADARVMLIPFSLTGPEITETEQVIEGIPIRLILPRDRDEKISEILRREGAMICVDYTHPSAINDNADFYCRHGIPFVMGTTGGDRARLEETVRASAIPAVIAPNMAKQIVGFQAMMDYAAENFPGLFKGYRLEIRESHQKGKADTSGTAKAMVGYFNRLGIPFAATEIAMERDPRAQKTEWGIPEAYLGGHGWHTYRLLSEDGTVLFSFTHNVNGREIYALGTLDAIAFLSEKIRRKEKGAIYSMIDVLKDA